MTRAARLAIAYAFDRDGIEVVHWRAYVGNWASRRTAWRLGFRVEGTVRQLLTHDGRRYDAWTGSLLKGEPMEPPHRWFDVPVLEGERVRLRPWREDDAPATDPAPDEPGRRFLGGFVLTRGVLRRLAHRPAHPDRRGRGRRLVHRRRQDRPPARPHPLLQAGAGAHRRQRHGRLLAAPRGPWSWRRERGPRAAGRACLRRPRRRGPGSAPAGGGHRRRQRRLRTGAAAGRVHPHRHRARDDGRTTTGPPPTPRCTSCCASADREAARVRPLVPAVLEGAQVRLRPWRDDDTPGPQEQPDEASRRFMPAGAHPTPAEFPTWLAKRRAAMDAAEDLHWCIADRSSRPRARQRAAVRAAPAGPRP